MTQTTPNNSETLRQIAIKATFETYKQYQIKERAIKDPTTLILVDESDRLHMNSLEQIRSIFDEGTAGLVLILLI